jgi:hypothetical protein
MSTFDLLSSDAVMLGYDGHGYLRVLGNNINGAYVRLRTRGEENTVSFFISK